MVNVTCDIDGADIDRLCGLFERIQRETPKRLATETRRAAIYICQSLRARTKAAPKMARRREYRAVVSSDKPRYNHSNGNGRLLHRWSLTRKLGTPDQYTRNHYVYATAHREKGKMVGHDLAKERDELVEFHCGIKRPGLAKLSWGWAMKQIYNGFAAVDWKRPRGERRDPRKAVRGLFRKTVGGAFATILNKLDYIADAIRPGAVQQAVDAAANRLEHNIQNGIERQTA